MGNALAEAGVDAKNLESESDRLSNELEELKGKQEGVKDGADRMGSAGLQAVQAYQQALVSSGIMDALEALYDEIVDCYDASVVFESAITGVYKTVDGTTQELESIKDEIKDLATEIPATTEEIAAVAEAAGQLGIATGSVMEFTTVMINLGEATNLSAEEAASSLAKFANITGTTAANYSRLGSVIVDLGNNFETTEADIVAMATRLASAGTLVGLTEADIMALSAAMSSVGIEAEAGGTAMSQTMATIEKAVANAGDELYAIADVAGMSAEEFAAAWETSPIVAVQAFIAGLGKLEDKGENATIVLDELGMSGIRQSNMLKSLALASNTLSGAVNTANTAWEENIALTEEANKRYATTESMQKMMLNAFNNLEVAIGDAYTPTMRDLYAVATDVLNVMTDFVEENPGLVKAVTATVGTFGAATTALTAYAAVANVVKAANGILTTAFGGSLGAIVAVTAGVAALAGAVTLLTDETNSEAAAVREMTEASRADYYQLQELNAEYENACAAYGETSDQATYLAWQIDDLNASFENSKQSLVEYVEESNAASDSMNSMLDANRDAYEQIGINEGTTLALVNRLRDLASQTDQTVETQEEMKAIITELNGIVPELAISYEDVVNGVTDYAAAIEATVKAEAAKQRYEKSQQSMTDALNAQYEAEQLLAEAKDNQTAAQIRYNRAYADYCSTMDTYSMNGQNPFAGITMWLTSEQKELNAAKDALETYNAEVEKWQNNLDSATSEYQEYLGSMVDYVETMEESTTTTAELNTVINNAAAELTALAEAYEEAYKAAYESVSGQYALWDEAAEVVATSADTINQGIDSQITYWQNYNANLQSLTERSKDIEGLSEMISSFADGSSESVNAVAGMASATDEELAAMVTDWQTLMAEQDKVAGSLAELEADFANSMANLQSQLESDIAAMNLSSEAAASGRNTIQGFIDGGNAMLPAVQAAYARIAQAAMDAIDSQLDINSPSKEMEWRAEMTWAGYINQTRAMEPELANAMSEAAEVGADAATVAAYSLQAVPVEAQRKEVQSSQSANLPPINVNISVEGNATDDTVQSLKDAANELVEAVLEAIDDRETDRQRRVYS